MSEAIITRASSTETTIQPSPDRHMLLVKCAYNNGSPVNNVLVQCKDGTRWYNYYTNMKGQTLFAVNSGYANVQVYNYINGNRIMDYNSCGFQNIAAPVGTVSSINFTINQGINSLEFSGSSTFTLSRDLECNVFIIGGGGGGACRWSGGSNYPGGGGGGYINYANRILPSGNYNIIIGNGGRGGNRYLEESTRLMGLSGETSYIRCDGNGIVSAPGGGGGSTDGTGGSSGGTGGNGGKGGRGGENGYNSTVNFAGGGGGGCANIGISKMNGGYPNGGSSSKSGGGSNGSRGGGGGAGGTSDDWGGGYGGNGYCKILIYY